jgi:hypothetical protein
VVILQNCLDVLRGEDDSCTETCPTLSGDGKQFVVDDDDDDDSVIKQQENQEPITSTPINNECVVSHMSVYPVLRTWL